MKLKTCTKCRNSLPENKFYKNKATLSGLDNFCKECRKIRTSKECGFYANPYRYVKEAKQIISHGNFSCVCCRNKNMKWLQIDHIKPVKSKKNRVSSGIISRKIVLGLISGSDFQLLCSNCNFAKGILDKCPIDHSLD